MVYRDQMLVCDRCGATFFFTVTQQRRMAEELGHQEFEAPHLCPKCRQHEAEPAAVGEVSVGSAPEEKTFEPVHRAPEPAIDAKPVAAPKAAATPKPAAIPKPAFVLEPEPEPELLSEPDLHEDERDEAFEVLPAFDESMLNEIGIKIKLIGSVKWFSLKKGFGFVTKADGEELFFHRSDVQEADVRQLADGMQVEFQIRRTGKGLEAFDVNILPTS